jgi:hypothetical protein
LPDFDQRTPFYGASRFTYDPERDEYRCPEGQVLQRKTAKYTEGVVVQTPSEPWLQIRAASLAG